jgi:hypothetical protein
VPDDKRLFCSQFPPVVIRHRISRVEAFQREFRLPGFATPFVAKRRRVSGL